MGVLMVFFAATVLPPPSPSRPPMTAAPARCGRRCWMPMVVNASNTIVFNIAPGGHQVITPLTVLPALTGAGSSSVISIDGASQPGFAGAPLIELDCHLSPTALPLASCMASVCWPRTVCDQQSGDQPCAGQPSRLSRSLFNNLIQGCYLGTDASGKVALTNDSAIYMVGSGTA